jgi:hypothetical protein
MGHDPPDHRAMGMSMRDAWRMTTWQALLYCVGDVTLVGSDQGAPVPDVNVPGIGRAELGEKFDDLYAQLNLAASAAARQGKVDRLAASR